MFKYSAKTVVLVFMRVNSCVGFFNKGKSLEPTIVGLVTLWVQMGFKIEGIHVSY